MNPNWLGVLSSIFSMIAFFVVCRGFKRKPWKMRLALAALSMVAAIPGASLGVYYAHVVPEWRWYYQFRSIEGTETLLVMVGVAGGLAASLLPRMMLMLPLLGTAAFSFVPFIKPFVGPIPEGTFRNDWDRDVCLQSTPSTCGAASTATILRQFDVEATEAILAAEAHSYSGGTEAWYLARAVRSRGLEVKFDFASGFAPDGGFPAVVGVRIGTVGHFIAILGQEEDCFIVGDPLRGREQLTRGELERRYIFTGFHMRIRNEGEIPQFEHETATSASP